MATTGPRRVLLRSLPVLLFLLLALIAAPQRATVSPRPAAAIAAAEVSPEQPDSAAETAAEAAPAPTDRTTVLSAQFTAGVRGSRAPPAASV